MRRREFVLTSAAGLTLASTALTSTTWAAAPAKPFMSLSYTPSGVDLEAELARGVAETRIRLDIELVKKFTDRIRTYTVDRGLDRVLPMAQQAGLKVSLGLYLGRDKTHNDLEIARGQKLYATYNKIIERIYVGNECLQRKDMGVAELVNYVRRVRTFIANPALQVGTAEAWYDWQKNKELGAVCDFVGAHLFPYWDGVPVGDAVDYVDRRYDELKAAFPGKAIVISETGWPSAGPRHMGAVPSLEGQEQFTRAFLARAALEKYDYNFCEAYDQPWKGKSLERGVGAHWGLFDRIREPKIPLVGA
jgi:exo-beta-1,3-glucanase (GH17 family)